MSAPKLEQTSVAAISYRDQSNQLLIRVFARGQDQQLHICTFDEHSLLWKWTQIPAPPNNIGIHKVLGTATFNAGPQYVLAFVHALPENTIHVWVSQEGIQSGWQAVTKAQKHVSCSEMGVVTYDDNGSPQVYGLCTDSDLFRVHGSWKNNALVLDETNEGKPGGNSFPLSGGRPGAISFVSADQVPQHQIVVYAVGSVPGSGDQLCRDFRAVSADESIDASKKLSSTWIWSVLGAPTNNQAKPISITNVAADFYSSFGSPGQARVYAVATGGDLWLFTNPSNWKSLGHPKNTQALGTPSVISYPGAVAGSSVENVFVAGLDGSLYEHSDNAPWVSLGKPAGGWHVSNPSAIAIPAAPIGLHAVIPPVQVYCVSSDTFLYASLKQPKGQFLWSTPLGA